MNLRTPTRPKNMVGDRRESTCISYGEAAEQTGEGEFQTLTSSPVSVSLGNKLATFMRASWKLSS